MPSLNARRRATEVIRTRARVSLELDNKQKPAPGVCSTRNAVLAPLPPEVEIDNSLKPVLPVLTLSKATVQAVPVPAASGDVKVAPDKMTQRYRWRCTIVHMARRHKDRAGVARDFAYNRRQHINKAFDKGMLKADLLDELGALFTGTGEASKIAAE